MDEIEELWVLVEEVIVVNELGIAQEVLFSVVLRIKLINRDERLVRHGSARKVNDFDVRQRGIRLRRAR